MTAFSSRYTVLTPGVEIRAEVERKSLGSSPCCERADSADEAQTLPGPPAQARTPHRSPPLQRVGARADRRIQRANDDGEPSGTAGAPMLEALTKAQMPAGTENLSDVAAVVVRWFGGTLLGAGGLVSAYSDAVVAGLDHARQQKAFLTRQRMAVFSLPAPIAEAGRWENELRSAHITVLGTDYASSPGSAVLNLAVADEEEPILTLQARTASLSSGGAELTAAGVDWVDAP